MEHAYLLITNGSQANQRIEFMFNPASYSITKSIVLTTTPRPGHNVPTFQFGGGNARTLKLAGLVFDATLPPADWSKGSNDSAYEGQWHSKLDQADVRKVTNKLFNLMFVDSGLQESNSQQALPPKVKFCWGQDSPFHFTGYVTSCTAEYTMFNGRTGKPIRAKVNLDLTEATDSDERLPTNPTSLGEPGRRMHRVSEGDRLDLIAFKEYGDASEWRRIAAANGLVNPLDLRPGMYLAIPPR